MTWEKILTQHDIDNRIAPLRFSWTVSVKPITILFTFPSFVFYFILFLNLGGRRSSRKRNFTTREKPNTMKIKPYQCVQG